MKIYKILDKTKAALIWAFIGTILCLLLIFPTECRNGFTNGIFLCLQVLIPSLFPFMLLSGFVTKSGIITRIPNCITKAFSSIFGISPYGVAVISLSLIGGYPVGAVAIKALHKENLLDDKDCEKLIMFCVSAGPGFLVTYIGAAMTRNLKLGYILLSSQIFSVVITGIIARFTINTDSRKTTQCKVSKAPIRVREALVYCVDNAIRAATQMCVLVMIFSGICEIFITLIESNPSLIWITALLEISNGIKFMAESYPTPLMAFVCGFGGICVHFQIFTQLSSVKFSKCNFYIFRILQGLICAGITFLLTKLFPISQSVFSTIENGKPQLYTSYVGCIFLVLTCLAFIVCVRQKRYNS